MANRLTRYQLAKRQRERQRPVDYDPFWFNEDFTFDDLHQISADRMRRFDRMKPFERRKEREEPTDVF